jgi:amino acid transporter
MMAGNFFFKIRNNLNIIAGELENPAINLPRSIVVGTTLVTICYFFENLAYCAVLDINTISNSKTIALEFGSVAMGKVGSLAIPIVVIFSTLGAANASILTGSRVILVSAQKGHAPEVFSKIDDKTQTPVNALLSQSLLSTLLILYGDFQTLVNMYSMIAWVFYFLAVSGLFVLRITEPFAERPFKVWLICPFLFCVVSLSLLFFSVWEAPKEGLLALMFMFSGLIFYILKEYHHGNVNM